MFYYIILDYKHYYKILLHQGRQCRHGPCRGKAHDIRAFTASKAFYGGISIDQIIQACHWKSHNTFTRFYLGDLAGQNQSEDSFQLGAFIAAQQVMPPFDQVPRKKKGGHNTRNHLDGECQNPLTP